MNTTDEKLYKEAQARVNFKRHFGFYLVMNVVFWATWYFTRGRYGYWDGMWPIWATLGWGIGIASHYLGVYVRSDSAVEREYQKLKNKNESKH